MDFKNLVPANIADALRIIDFHLQGLPDPEDQFDSCMLDIETYGLHDNCPVWAVVFNFFNYKDDQTFAISFILDVRYQVQPLHMVADTGFWDELDPHGTMRETIMADLIVRSDLCYHVNWESFLAFKPAVEYFLKGYLRDPEVKGALVANDIDFDKVHMEQLFKTVHANTQYPWHYRSFMSLPTINRLAEMKTGIDFKKQYTRVVRNATHNPLDDTDDQILYTRQALFELMETEKTDEENY